MRYPVKCLMTNGLSERLDEIELRTKEKSLTFVDWLLGEGLLGNRKPLISH